MEKYLNREVILKKEFSGSAVTFGNYYSALGFLNAKDYDTGSMCHPLPIAIVKNADYFATGLPQKWKNFTEKEKERVDGVVVSNDFRHGVVTVYLFK